MKYRSIIIEGEEENIEIRRTDQGAVVCSRYVNIEVERTDSREDRFAVAYNAAIPASQPRCDGSNLVHACTGDSRRVLCL